MSNVKTNVTYLKNIIINTVKKNICENTGAS